MELVDWNLRLRVVIQRLTQPTCACMLCMSAPSFAALVSLPHWKIALQTGLGTGVLALLLLFTPVGRLFGQRYGNAVLMGVLTAVADAWSHPGRFEAAYGEALLTGVVSGLIVLATSFLVEDRARRVREAWARIRGAKTQR
ncbi:MAG: hypothetical protein ABI585_12570 [Betaproteobacteria bacterium]